MMNIKELDKNELKLLYCALKIDLMRRGTLEHTKLNEILKRLDKLDRRDK